MISNVYSEAIVSEKSIFFLSQIYRKNLFPRNLIPVSNSRYDGI